MTFVPNRCRQCKTTTDSQTDKYCDDCFSLLPWTEQHLPLAWFLAGSGLLYMSLDMFFLFKG